MTLRDGEVRAVETVVADLADVGDLQTYAERAVEGLRRLIPTDLFYSFNELRQEPLDLPFTFGDPQARAPELVDPMARYWRQSPTSSANVGTAGGVFRWSDLVSRRELEGLDYYHEVCRPKGERHAAKVAFPAGPLESDAFMLSRRDTDFSDRDMEVLRLLYPFLFFAHRAVKSRERSDRAERELRSRGLGVVLVRPDGRIVDRVGGAAEILREWFGTRNGSLPPELAVWIKERHRRSPLDAAQELLVLTSGDRTLVIRHLLARGEGEPDELLMQEQHLRPNDEVARSFGLTARETEVLGLVRDGMTNREVAETLFLAPTTVRRHLENVFSKLEVRTRTAAVAKAFPARTSLT